MKDYFEILQISDDADDAEIEAAYNNMLCKYPADQYPDKNKDVIKAYRMLTNPSIKQSCLDFHNMDFVSKQVYILAEQAINEGNFNGAIKIINKTIKMEKHSDHLYYLLGIAYFKLEKYIKAAKAFERVLHRYPNDVDILALSATAYIENENYKKALIPAEKGYTLDKDNISLIYSLAEGYVHTGKYGNAVDVLKKAMDNSAFHESRYNICVRISYALFLDRKFEESHEYMERLITFETTDEEKIASGELLLSVLDYYLDSQMYSDANRFMGVIIRILPDREDIVEYKRNIEKILKLEPEFSRFEEDDSVPDGLVGLVAAELFPGDETGMTEEQKKAYTFMNEYHILLDCTPFLMPLRYIKREYPGLYELKKDFFDALQDTKKRKIMKTKYQTQLHQYQDVFEELMEEWEEEIDEETDEEEDIIDSGYESNEHDEEISNVRPFIRSVDKVGRNDLCPCGSGKKYKKCCGKNS